MEAKWWVNNGNALGELVRDPKKRKPKKKDLSTDRKPAQN